MPSTAIHPVSTATWRPLPALARVLAGVLAFLTIGALQGGIAMLLNPQTPLGMTTDYLDRTPFESYTLPGLYLVAIATAAGITAAGITFRWQWMWASKIEAALGYRWQWIGAVAVGVALLVLEVVELFTVPFHPIMHPLMIAVGLIAVGLPLIPKIRREYSVS